MNKFLPNELQNLNENKERVMQNVEQTIDKKSKEFTLFRHWKVAFVTTLVFIISGVSIFLLQNSSEEIATKPIDLSVGAYDSLLQTYFAPDNTQKKGYVTDEQEYLYITTNKISNQYVMESACINNNCTNTYYRIANNEVGIILESKEVISDINYLNTLPIIETYLKAPLKVNQQIGEWKVEKVDEHLNGFTNGLVLTTEKENQQGVRIFIPQLGFMQEYWWDGDTLLNQLNIFEMNVLTSENDLTFSKFDNLKMESTSNISWQQSPDGTMSVTLDGRLEQASEEGIANLLVKNNELDSYTILSLTNASELQLTPKTFKWIDDNRLFLIIGFAYGTVSMGGDLYILELEQNKLIPVVLNASSLEEVSNIWSTEANEFKYEKFIYDSEIMDSEASHTELGEIKIVKGTVLDMKEDLIHYQIENVSAATYSELALQENKSANALTLDDVEVNQVVELILIDGKVAYLNKLNQ